MAGNVTRKRIWGWFFFDWASQPYNTLLLTFIFAPYVKELMGDGSRAQAAWGFGIAAAGFAIALLAPILGALADTGGNRLRWIWGFSGLYVLGSAMLWFTAPGDFNLVSTLFFFALGLVGMEFATIFTNAMLPDLGPREQIGAISGSGWAWGYVGGVVALAIILLLFAENAAGVTFIGLSPALGLDPEAREGTRFVGPFVAVWYVVFMIPFFLWVRETGKVLGLKGPVSTALRDLVGTVRRLPGNPSLTSYLGSSMLYRDALNGMYTFGGVYALGVLGWTVVDIGVFGIVAAITGAVFAWLGGRADRAFGPKPVIRVCIVVLLLVAITIATISREAVLGIAIAPGSSLPDIAYYICGALIGAAGGALQSASRTMMVRQANPERMTEAFGLYALAGRATTFVAPALIAIVTDVTGSQQLGVTPLIGLFLAGLVLLAWVKPDGDRAEWSESSPSLA